MRLSIVLSIALLLSAILTCSEDGPTKPSEPQDTAFSVVSISPSNGAIDAAIDTSITITFSKPVRSTTVSPNSIILEPTTDYTIDCPVASMTAVLHPSNSLLHDQPYTVRVLPSVVSVDDDTLVGSREFTFRTMVDSVKIRPFTVTSITPANGADEVDPNSTDIEIQFSKPIRCFTVTSNTVSIDPPVPFSIDCSTPNGTVILRLSGGLGFDQQYTVSLTGGIRSAYDDSLPSTPRTFSFHTAPLPTNAVYVAWGYAGDGTASSPFGTIQEGVDAAGSLTDGMVMVGAGQYYELVTISAPVTIRGGLSPGGGWGPHPTSSTVINGGLIDGNGVGMVIRNVTGQVLLNDLTVKAPDATQPGCGSYGIVCSDATSVVIGECQIAAGDAQDGVSGQPGSAGMPGEDGDFCTPGINFAAGGAGGAGAPLDGSPGPGAQGFCSDGSQTGGLPGQVGPSGSAGPDGIGGPLELRIESTSSLPLLHVLGGGDGSTGDVGCGGGGGGGGWDFWDGFMGGDPIHYPGGCGGGGGGAGTGGSGGTGGTGGGSSVALIAFNSDVALWNCLLDVGEGGNGGQGGSGGNGGHGGKGGWGDSYGLTYPGVGGDGGDGGRGGHGGGGAGGWSIGIALANGATLSGETPSVTFGLVGAGGTSPGNPGARGQLAEVYTVPE